MKTLVTPSRLAPRLPWAAVATGGVWLLVAASAVHWGLRLGVHGDPVPSQVQTVGVAQALQGDAGRLFVRTEAVATAAAPSPARDRFRVLGVAARDGDGWALISVDGKPPRAYRRGASVDGRWEVLAVGQRRIDIGPPGGPAAVTLDLPPLPSPSTGQLPAVSTDITGAGTAPVVTPVPQRPLAVPPEGIPAAAPQGGGEAAPPGGAPVVR